MLSLVLPGPEDLNDSDGTEAATLSKSCTPAASSLSPDTALILSGTSCREASRLVEVTTTSSRTASSAVAFTADRLRPTVREDAAMARAMGLLVNR
ncbi:MAG: hypothetical protein P8Y45_18670 [Exilibacterium sp.]